MLLKNEKYVDEKPLYNSQIIYTYIKLIKNRYSFINVNDLLKYAGMELHQVLDQGHWFNQRQVNLFYEKLEHDTGNINIAREAGRFTASPEGLGVMRRYLVGLMGPSKLYELLGIWTKKLTRSSNYEARRLGPNKFEITVTPHENVKEEAFQCENRLGYLQAFSELFNYKLPKVSHPECLFKGNNHCRYIVSWQETRSVLWKKVRIFTSIIFGCFFIITPYFFSISTTFLSILPLSVSIISILSWYIYYLDNIDLNKVVEYLRNSTDELIDQINVNYENSLLINEIGQALSHENDLDGVLAEVVNVLENRLDYDRGLILLANENKTRLVSRAGYGYELDELSKFMMGSGFHLDRKTSKGILINCFRNQQPYLVNNLDDIKDDLSARSLEFAQKLEVKSFICCPIVYEGESLGVLAVDNLETKSPLVQSDINVLMGIAPQIAVAIHNIKLVDAKLKQFQSILQALVASTEARDPITAGHSEKVTEYALGICQELGLPNEYTDMIRVAASLHDYGKIGVDDSVLKKPSRLNDNEYEQIKTHALKTKNILSEVNFEGIYQEVPEIAASHHEKLDGTGYPQGLTEEEIPYGAKIIAVADVFEALTSRRHYRDPMPINEAFEYLIKGIGQEFDKDCVEAFINYYNKLKTPIPFLYKGSFESLINANNKDGSNKSNIYPLRNIKSEGL